MILMNMCAHQSCVHSDTYICECVCSPARALRIECKSSRTHISQALAYKSLCVSSWLDLCFFFACPYQTRFHSRHTTWQPSAPNPPYHVFIIRHKHLSIWRTDGRAAITRAHHTFYRIIIITFVLGLRGGWGLGDLGATAPPVPETPSTPRPTCRT